MATAVYRSEPGLRRVQAVAMFMFPYLVLTTIAALALGDPWPLTTFWLLTLNRWLGPLLSRAEPEGRYRFVMVSWIVSLGLYCIVIPLALALPVPALGLEGYQVAPGTFPESASAEGGSLEQAMAAGAAYFTLNGLSELAGHRWVPERWRLGTARSRSTPSSRSRKNARS